MNEKAATLLRDKRQIIGERVTQRYIDQHPDFLQRRGEQGRARCSEDAAYHLTYLAEAVRFKLPKLFVDYLSWAKVLLNSLKLPENDLAKNLTLISEVTREELPPDIFAIVQPVLSQAMDSLGELPKTVETFLKPDAPHYDLADRWLKHLLKHESREARQLIISAADNGIRLPDLYNHVLTPCLREVGRLWQLRQINEAEEHYCSQFTQAILAMLSARITPPWEKKSVVGFCVEGEHHDVGIRLALDCFALQGWNTVCFGANVPTRNVRNIVSNWHPDIVAISATMVYNLPQVRSVIAEINEISGRDRPRVLVGGRPFMICPELSAKVGADGTVTDCTAAAATLDDFS